VNEDPPGPPGIPFAVDSSEDSVTLSWNRPRTDGGSPIQGYIIERRNANSGEPFTRANHALCSETTYR
jgi:titin